MRLTRFTDLALRVLMRLAVADEGDREAPPTTREVAETMRVPYTHTAKVVARLQHLGLVEARRGAAAGSRSPRRAAGRRSAGWSANWRARATWSSARGPCRARSTRRRRLRGALRRAQEAFCASLDPLTVADLVSSPTGPLLIGLVGGRRTDD